MWGSTCKDIILKKKTAIQGPLAITAAFQNHNQSARLVSLKTKYWYVLLFLLKPITTVHISYQDILTGLAVYSSFAKTLHFDSDEVTAVVSHGLVAQTLLNSVLYTVNDLINAHCLIDAPVRITLKYQELAKWTKIIQFIQFRA